MSENIMKIEFGISAVAGESLKETLEAIENLNKAFEGKSDAPGKSDADKRVKNIIETVLASKKEQEENVESGLNSILVKINGRIDDLMSSVYRRGLTNMGLHEKVQNVTENIKDMQKMDENIHDMMSDMHGESVRAAMGHFGIDQDDPAAMSQLKTMMPNLIKEAYLTAFQYGEIGQFDKLGELVDSIQKLETGKFKARDLTNLMKKIQGGEHRLFWHMLTGLPGTGGELSERIGKDFKGTAFANISGEKSELGFRQIKDYKLMLSRLGMENIQDEFEISKENMDIIFELLTEKLDFKEEGLAENVLESLGIMEEGKIVKKLGEKTMLPKQIFEAASIVGGNKGPLEDFISNALPDFFVMPKPGNEEEVSEQVDQFLRETGFFDDDKIEKVLNDINEKGYFLLENKIMETLRDMIDVRGGWDATKGFLASMSKLEGGEFGFDALGKDIEERVESIRNDTEQIISNLESVLTNKLKSISVSLMNLKENPTDDQEKIFKKINEMYNLLVERSVRGEGVMNESKKSLGGKK